MHNTFFSWNFTMLRISATFLSKSSLCWHIVGNLPALFRPGPSNLGICGIRTCEAKKASKDCASFLTSFLFLLSFFKSSTLLKGMLRQDVPRITFAAEFAAELGMLRQDVPRITFAAEFA